MTSQFRRWERNPGDDASRFPVANVPVPAVSGGFRARLYRVCNSTGDAHTLLAVIPPLKLRQAPSDGGSGVVFDCNPTHLPVSLPLTQTTQCSFVSRKKE